MDKTAEPEWLDRVRVVNRFHIEKLRENPKWTIKQTADHFKRAIGPVSEELKVAHWMKTHSSQLCEFEFLHEAVAFIRERKHKFLSEDI